MRLELPPPLNLAARKLLLQQLSGNTGPANLYNAVCTERAQYMVSAQYIIVPILVSAQYQWYRVCEAEVSLSGISLKRTHVRHIQTMLLCLTLCRLDPS